MRLADYCFLKTSCEQVAIESIALLVSEDSNHKRRRAFNVVVFESTTQNIRSLNVNCKDVYRLELRK